MTLIAWSPLLTTGVLEIDEQHRKLIDLLNKLNETTRSGRDKNAMKAALRELVDCTIHHFGTEERLMARLGYAEAEAHQAEHKKLVRDVRAFKARVDDDSAVISSEIMNFLRDWLARHIVESDRKLGKALNSAGIR